MRPAHEDGVAKLIPNVRPYAPSAPAGFLNDRSDVTTPPPSAWALSRSALIARTWRGSRGPAWPASRPTWPRSGDSFPGQSAIRDEYDGRCLSALESYAPDAANDPRVTNFLLYPTQKTWDRGDRDVVCIAITKDKPTGSIKE